MHTLKSISDYHKLAGLPKPEHPLVSLVEYDKVNYQTESGEITLISPHYSIAMKRGVNGKMRYGQQPYDFDEGVMSFVAPGQVINVKVHKEPEPKPTGWILFIHPDFLWNTPLAKNIKNYEFFGYQINEALFLSEREETSMIRLMKNIQEEYHANTDKFSQNIIISQIETLLNYAERFYQRQFITRKITNHKTLDRLENILADCFNSDALIENGLPTVQDLSDKLHMSPGYLSSLLKTLTGQSAQQHIHNKLIEKAKEKLSTTELSVSEIAYDLGFQHPQSFSKFFKTKTKQSPLEFRQSFN